MRLGVTLLLSAGWSVGRKGQIPLTGISGTLRMKPVLGETYMPPDCVILEGGGNAELRSWKAFGKWVNIIHRVSSFPEHAPHAARDIVTFIQSAAALGKKVMDDLNSEERRFVAEESSALVLSLLESEGGGGHGQSLSERVRRLSERALQKMAGMQ